MIGWDKALTVMHIRIAVASALVLATRTHTAFVANSFRDKRFIIHVLPGSRAKVMRNLKRDDLFRCRTTLSPVFWPEKTQFSTSLWCAPSLIGRFDFLERWRAQYFHFAMFRRCCAAHERQRVPVGGENRPAESRIKLVNRIQIPKQTIMELESAL